MSLRKRLATFLIVVGAIALLIFILDLTSPEDVHQWGALLFGLAALALGIILGPGRDSTAPPRQGQPAARPTSPPAAAPRPAAPPAKPGFLAGLFRPKAPAGKAAPPPPPPPPPKKGLAGLFKPKPKPAPVGKGASAGSGSKASGPARPNPTNKKK